MPSPACQGLSWCKCFSLPCPDDTSSSDMDLLSSKGSALLGPSLSLSLAALSLCSPAPVPSPVPSAAPQAGSASPPQAPCVFFLPAAQVLPQRAPDAAGAEGGAGLPVPECELCVCVGLAQPWAWPSLGVPHHLLPARGRCVLPQLLPLVTDGSPLSHTSPRTGQRCPLFALWALGIPLFPGLCLFLSPLGSRSCGQGSELSPVASRLR